MANPTVYFKPLWVEETGKLPFPQNILINRLTGEAMSAPRALVLGGKAIELPFGGVVFDPSSIDGRSLRRVQVLSALRGLRQRGWLSLLKKLPNGRFLCVLPFWDKVFSRDGKPPPKAIHCKRYVRRARR